MKRPGGWPAGIVLLLTVFVGANLFMMHIAADDPAFAVEPDYYKKAVAFDSTMAQERRSVALGWKASSAIAAGQAAGAASRTVTVTLADAGGAAITGAAVNVDARWNARANDVLSVPLHETAPGTYAAVLAVKHPGEWEVRVDAVRGNEHFVTSTRATAPSDR